jgi:hypothetical protein
MRTTDSELRRAVRRALETIGDSVGPPRPFDDIVPIVEPDGQQSGGRSGRILAAIGAGVVVVALIGGLALLEGGTEPSPIGGADTTEGSASTLAQVVTTAPADPTTTVGAVDQLTIDDVREGQTEALRRLSGFTATAEVTRFFTSGDEQPQTRTNEVTLLADGSFWAQAGPEEWGSYDPVANVVRGAFRGADGTIQFQEIVGQADNSLPLGVLIGMNPVQLVGTLPGESSDIAATTFEGRPVWEITTAVEYDLPVCRETCEGDPYTQTMVETIDQVTGLVIRSSNSTTQQNGTSQVSVLRDVRTVDSLPAAFPGAFPDGATVDRSGDPTAAVTVTLDDVSGFFGIPTPVPSGLGDVSVTVEETAGFDPDGSAFTSRSVAIVVSDGFLTTSIYVSASTVPEGDLPREGVVDGYLCMTGDHDGDGACDPDPLLAHTPLVEGEEIVTIDRGVLAGTQARAAGGYISWSSGPFSISIGAPTTAEALAIANAFELR